MPNKKRPNRLRKAKSAPHSRGRSPRGAERRSAHPVDRSRLAPDDRSTRAPDAPLATDERILTSNLTMHQLFEQQTARMLERADLNEEQKQSLLVGMSCPCCGAAGFSFTAKLRRR